MPESLKKYFFFYLTTAFYNFTLKTDIIWGKKGEIRNAIILLPMLGLFILG